MRFPRMFVALLLLSAIGCGSDTTVGSGVDVGKLSEEQRRLGEAIVDEGGEGDEGGSLALGEKEKQQQDAAERDKEAADQRKAQQEQIEKERELAAYEFTITESGYNPYYIRVFKGGTIKVTNADRVPRTITADKGEFDSGTIAPGGSWVGGPFNQLGSMNFHDETRPYVVGTLEVVAR